jgi:hypothetical protein
MAEQKKTERKPKSNSGTNKQRTDQTRFSEDGFEYQDTHSESADLLDLLLRLAFQLVIADRATPPTLLIEMKAGMLIKALKQRHNDVKIPMPLSEIESLLDKLEKDQPNFKPNKLWLSWMKSTRTDLIQTFRQELLI